MIIALDCDGVICDCATPVHQAYERLLQRKLRGPDEWHDFDFAESMFLEPEEAQRVHEQITREGTLAWRIGLYEGAREFVQALLAGEHEVFFLTSQWSGMSSWVPAREELLHAVFPGLDIVFTHNKSRAQFDLLIDDKPKTVRENSDRAWLMSRPWNRGMKYGMRFETYSDILKGLGL